MEKRSGELKKLGFRRSEGIKLPSSSSSSSYRGSWRPSPYRSNETTGSQEENFSELKTIESGHDRSQDIPSLVGTCPDMCPAKERAQRERLRDLSMFERISGNPGRTSSSLAVKKFCRTLSTRQVQMSDIRPLPVLQDTLVYLFNLIDSPGHPFEEVHEFIFDRTRSIRQDLSMQLIVNEEASHMYEEMVKFHITSHQRLLRCSGKSGVSSLLHLNMEQLMKSLVSLYDMYAHKKSSTTSINKNKAEFYSFNVLLHLGSNSQAMGDSLAVWFRQLAFPILHSKEMRFARSVLRYFKIGNYKRFFSTISAEASFLQLCLLEPVINEVRARAISFINYSGYKLHPYPLAHLSELLVIEVSDLDSLCKACGLETCTDEAGCKLLPTKQTGFCLPKGGFQSFSFLNSERLQRRERENY